MGAAPQFEIEIAPALANELAEIEKIREGINRYMGPEIEDEAKALLASTEGLTVAGHTDGPKAGREAVHAGLMRLIRFRTQMIDGGHETYKKPVNAVAKRLDERKKALTQMLAPREAFLKNERDTFDQQEADRKAEAARAAAAEKARIEAERAAEAKRVLQARIQRLVDLGAVPNVVELAGMTEEQFEAAVAAAAEVQATRIAQQEAERIEREREAERQRARTERIEARTLEVSRAGVRGWWTSLDQIADISEEEFRVELEQRVEAKRVADEAEAERLRLQAEEKARLDAERAELEAERQRLAALREQQEAAERAAEDERRRQREAEEASQAAEAKRIADEAAAALLEAQRPDRERIWNWLDSMELDVALGPQIQDDAVRKRWMDACLPIVSAVQQVKKEYAP